MSESFRPCSIARHPVSLQKYIVPTPSIDQLYAMVRRCVRRRVPGSLIYAMTRYGKTYATRYITEMLRQDFPGLVIVTFGCERKKVPSESAFFTTLLSAVQHPAPDAGTNSQKRLRLLNRLLDMLLKSGQNLLVLFADEAQKLQLEEYEWLREVHDALETRAYRMVTFLVGQPQLINQKTAFKNARQTQIVGRFMIDDIEFHGVRSAQDAASCLQGYDTACYPPESGWSFTRFFLPNAWHSGLRLQESAKLMWEEFSAVHQELGFRTPLEIPMTYFARSVEIVLQDIGLEHDAGGLRITPAVWKEAIAESRFAQAQEELLLHLPMEDS